MPLTLSQIIPVVAPTVVREICQPFASPFLNDMYGIGRIILTPLGATFTFLGQQYSINETFARITWSHQDEIRNEREEQKAALAKNLIENATQVLDNTLEEILLDDPYCCLAVSDNYNYKLGDIVAMDRSNVYTTEFYSYFAIYPGYARTVLDQMIATDPTQIFICVPKKLYNAFKNMLTPAQRWVPGPDLEPVEQLMYKRWIIRPAVELE